MLAKGALEVLSGSDPISIAGVINNAKQYIVLSSGWYRTKK